MLIFQSTLKLRMHLDEDIYNFFIGDEEEHSNFQANYLDIFTSQRRNDKTYSQNVRLE